MPAAMRAGGSSAVLPLELPSGSLQAAALLARSCSTAQEATKAASGSQQQQLASAWLSGRRRRRRCWQQ